MAKGYKKCKVCGVEYEYCKTNRPSGVFRYQDVACCPEHGSIYLARIIESRSGNVSNVVATEIDDGNTNVKTDTTVSEDMVDDDGIANEDDELFESEFDDDSEEIDIETK